MFFHKTTGMSNNARANQRAWNFQAFYLATFFQYNKRILRQKTGWACLYMPQDCLCLASFEVIPHPKMLVFRGQKNENSPQKTGCARPLVKKKSQAHFSSSSSSAVFVKNSVTPMSTLANNKRSCWKKWKKTCQNGVYFPVFPAKFFARFCHAVLDFREHQGLRPD